MKKYLKKIIIISLILISIITVIFIYQKNKADGILKSVRDQKDRIVQSIKSNENPPITKPGTKKFGEVLATYKDVSVYHNGDDYAKSYGKNYAKDGYYYGEKWQCVEFVKRFYHDALKHSMPDGYGNAKNFFDDNVAHGEINKTRGLRQYKNGGDEKPMPDDLIVFNDTGFGHVVIITSVTDDKIGIIQQNYFGVAEDKYKLVKNGNNYTIGDKRKPAGWLRKDK